MKPIFPVILTFLTTSVLPVQAQEAVPRLVVGITVDQLRSDYLNAFAPLYGEGGLKRLMAQGTCYTNVQYKSTNVDRASAIASVYTGTVPYDHGIVSTMWLDRKTLRPVFCVSDNKTNANSLIQSLTPSNLVTSTIGDELKVATKGKAKVYAIAPYSDAAILSAGHSGDCAIWIDDTSGQWVTSSYYGSSPACLRYINTSMLSNNINNIKWTPSDYIVGRVNYYIYGDELNSFSHRFTGIDKYRDYKQCGLVNETVSTAAASLLRAGEMGTDGIPDLLSLTYYAGHYNKATEGSTELQDTYVRLDRQIEELLTVIDKHVGLQHTLIFLTSTGYDDTPEDNLSQYGIPSSEFRLERCTALLNMYLTAIYGDGQYVDAHYGQYIYLNHKLIEDKQIALHEILNRCEDFLFQFHGVRDVYTSQRLTQGAWTPGISRIRNSYNPHCSGDIFVEITPGMTLVKDNGAKKVVRDSYLEIPLIFFGKGVKSQKIHTPVTIDYIAPTISHSIRIRAPNSCAMAPLTELSE